MTPTLLSCICRSSGQSTECTMGPLNARRPAILGHFQWPVDVRTANTITHTSRNTAHFKGPPSIYQELTMALQDFCSTANTLRFHTPRSPAQMADTTRGREAIEDEYHHTLSHICNDLLQFAPVGIQRPRTLVITRRDITSTTGISRVDR